MTKTKKNQPSNTGVEKYICTQSQKSFGPDDRGEHPTISRIGYNPITESNGLVISGPNGNGTI